MIWTICQPMFAAPDLSLRQCRRVRLAVHQSGFAPHRCRSAEIACVSPAVDSVMTCAAEPASPSSLISILSRAAAASRNSKDEGVAQVMYEAPISTASILTGDPYLESVALRSPTA